MLGEDGTSQKQDGMSQGDVSRGEMRWEKDDSREGRIEEAAG